MQTEDWGPPGRSSIGRLVSDGDRWERLHLLVQFICEQLEFTPDDPNSAITGSQLEEAYREWPLGREDRSGDLHNLYEFITCPLFGAEECMDGGTRCFFGVRFRDDVHQL